MQTLVRLHNANCTYCMNAVKDELLARPRVNAVQVSAAAGCLQVDHDHDDPSALTAVLRQSLHGWEAADNGEIISVTTSSEISEHCTRHENSV